jgi:hypothetical protein
MEMQTSRRLPALIVAAALVYAVIHLGYEHFTVGVQSHHLLNRADLPAVSNWLGLVTLPFVGFLLAVRIRAILRAPGADGLPVQLWVGLASSLLYGAALAVAFALGASSITSTLFLGLFLLAAVFPIYRAEFALGFVAGMAITFGAVLPALVAAVLAAISFGFRLLFRAIVAAARTLTRTSDGA